MAKSYDRRRICLYVKPKCNSDDFFLYFAKSNSSAAEKICFTAYLLILNSVSDSLPESDSKRKTPSEALLFNS